MAEAFVLFVFQQVVVSQHRYAVIDLAVQLINEPQPLADVDLVPGVVQAIFQLADDRIAQVAFQRAQDLAVLVRCGVYVDRFLRDQILVGQRFVQLAQIVLHLARLLQFTHVVFIDKAGTVPEFEFVVFRIRREDLDQLPALHFPYRDHMLAHQRIDFAIALRFHVFRFNRAVFRQQISQAHRGNQRHQNAE